MNDKPEMILQELSDIKKKLANLNQRCNTLEKRLTSTETPFDCKFSEGTDLNLDLDMEHPHKVPGLNLDINMEQLHKVPGLNLDLNMEQLHKVLDGIHK